jgi:cytoskeletal protein RodZ
MLSVGETLRRARLEQGLDLCTVAARTRISARYLEAIESDDRKILPSGFFYKSFVDQYAKSLSLDTQEIDAEIDRVLRADEPLPLPGFESVVARNVPPVTFAHRFHTRPSFAPVATLALVLAACSGVYAWWHEARWSMSFHGMIASVRGLAKPSLAKPGVVPHQSDVASAKMEGPAAQPRAPQPSAPQQSLAEPVAVPVSLASETKPAVAEESAIAPPGAVSDYKVMLDLMAHEATWLSVSSDGKPVFSGILQANQTKSVGGKQFAKMRVGNAAGLEVRLNGKLLGPLGARGQVLIVLFTPDNFQIFAPPKESD